MGGLSAVRRYDYSCHECLFRLLRGRLRTRSMHSNFASVVTVLDDTYFLGGENACVSTEQKEVYP